MALKRRKPETQETLWVAHDKVARSPGHPFYEALNRALSAHGFDRFAEDLCAPYYKEGGRPGIPPGVYFRMLFIGYFEGVGSERGIAWRCGDSLSLREFLGVPLGEDTPHHSSMTRIRQRLPLEVQIEVFQFVLKILAAEKLLSGKTLGIDATTLEANAAMRSIVRKDSGESYTEFLTELAKESGIETPTKEDLAKLDKTRKNKASNADWESPDDPDAGITKMKDGTTHLAHKSEHAVDLETDAVVAVDLSPGQTGDPQSIKSTLAVADANLAAVHEDHEEIPERANEAVTDKGYHNNATLTELAEDGTRSYISEPDRGRRNWKDKSAEQAATYANRRRIRGARGKRLMKLRAEKAERSFAHCYETGGMRRCTLRGTVNILKRLLVHVAAYNLGLVMRKLVGNGTPRGLADASKVLCFVYFGLVSVHEIIRNRLESIFGKFRLISLRFDLLSSPATHARAA
jgi:transposase